MDRLQHWSKSRLTGLFFFNLSIFILLLLRSAGYFHPFLPLTINMIFVITILSSVPLLGVGSKGVLLIALCFLSFGAMFKIVGIDIWAERMGIYVYESLLLGLLLVIWDKYKDGLNSLINKNLRRRRMGK